MVGFNMPKRSGRYSVCDDARRAPSNVGDGQHWGERGECDYFDDLEEARGFAAAVWSSANGVHTIQIRDDDRAGAVVASLPHLPHWRLGLNRARERRRVAWRSVAGKISADGPGCTPGGQSRTR